MNVLVACEESQRVCIAFREKGHNAFSCDILPCSGGHPEWHIQDNVFHYINGKLHAFDFFFMTQDGTFYEMPYKWDLIIAHPPCNPKYKGASRKGGSAKSRSKTFWGIAQAMADQWG